MTVVVVAIREQLDNFAHNNSTATPSFSQPITVVSLHSVNVVNRQTDRQTDILTDTDQTDTEIDR